MINQEILATLKAYAEQMQQSVSFVLQTGEHAKRAELQQFLSAIASVSDRIQFVERDCGQQLRSPISFLLEADGKDTGIRFSGIPSGHEFNSLILAMLQASGTDIKLDAGLQSMIASIEEPLNFEVFVSLSCHNCPEVVQALNEFALLNDTINVEMIDGGLYQVLIKERDIQGVPSVYLNGELFANGKITAAQLIEKLQQRAPEQTEFSGQQLPLQDVLVIGGGPAGVGAAVYSARKGLKVCLVADRIGGQVKDTMAIENLISVPETTGPKLSQDLNEHLRAYPVTVKEHVTVKTIDEAPIKTVTLSSGETIRSKVIIIASGAKWRELGVPGEKENIGNGVAYCPHCDGPFFKGKDVAVIGGGNSGIEAAIDLAGIAKSVSVYEFMPELKADEVLIKQAEARNNIVINTNVAVEAIEATADKVSAIVYKDRATDQQLKQPLHGVFVQIGLSPNSDFVPELIERTRTGEIIVNEKCQTNVPGIVACGDVTTVPYKQIVVAMGEGAKAALSAYEYLLAESANLEVEEKADATMQMAS